uniref:Uncharacterized protein n=1 Tax=viral metagenome TaxID=1070528 RepID=A0A6C0AHI1_9ZZZZ
MTCLDSQMNSSVWTAPKQKIFKKNVANIMKNRYTIRWIV